jgi:hypothetical protein
MHYIPTTVDLSYKNNINDKNSNAKTESGLWHDCAQQCVHRTAGTLRALELVLSYDVFPFRELVLPSRQ